MESCLQLWLKSADGDDGLAPPAAASNRGGGWAADVLELRELRKRNKLLEQEIEILRRATADFARDLLPMMYPLVHVLAAEKSPVAVSCRVLGLFKQSRYAWRKNPVCQRDWDDAHLINAAVDIHADDPAFGYQLIADGLREQGVRAGENRVARLCSQERLRSIFAKYRGLNRKAGPPVHDDVVDRKLTATGPNVTWLTDITEHNTAKRQALPLRHP